MKLNISFSGTGMQKSFEIDDPKKLESTFYDKRMSEDVRGDLLGDEFKGYVFRIMGGNDKQGFSMKQGVLTNTRVRILMKKGATCYRPRRTGERKRKSVRGCIVGPDISALHLTVVKKGDEEIPGLTDGMMPRRLGPKRASHIRKLFNLSKDDDVRKYVIRREVVRGEGKKNRTKAPKIQRLVTPLTLQRKRRRRALEKKRVVKSRDEARAYAKLLATRAKESREKRQAKLSEKRNSDKRASNKA